MAARKSCTHLTRAEAKAKVGGDGRASSKKSLIPKKVDHGKALTAKVIAKNGASQQDISKEKTQARRVRRGEEHAAAAAAKRAEEKERRRMEAMVKPFDMARDRMKAMAEKLQEEDCSVANGKNLFGMNNIEADGEEEARQQMVECRELQANEVLGLEAIYNADGEDDAFRIGSSFEVLQKHLEQWQMDPDDQDAMQSIVQHPCLSFTIQLVVDGSITEESGDTSLGDGSVDLVCVLLLRVSLPPFYPSGEESSPAGNINPRLLPAFDIEDFVCTHRGMKCTPDKPLVSLAHLDEFGLKQLMTEEAKQLLPIAGPLRVHRRHFVSGRQVVRLRKDEC